MTEVRSTSLTVFETCFIGCLGIVLFVMLFALFAYWITEWISIRRGAK